MMARDPFAFRSSVEARIRARATVLRVAPNVLRRRFALERLVCRLEQVSSGLWIYKGGFALQTVLGPVARPSMDLDAEHRQGANGAREDLRTVSRTNGPDFFHFELVRAEPLSGETGPPAVRFRVDCFLAGRLFEPVHVGVACAPPSAWDGEPVHLSPCIPELEIPPVQVVLLPMERQVAEKFHAYTRTYGGNPSTRSKDLVDLVLIARSIPLSAQVLARHLHVIFRERGTHPLPPSTPAPPESWKTAYGAEAGRLNLPEELHVAHGIVSRMLDPILNGSVDGRWDPSTGERRR